MCQHFTDVLMSVSACPVKYAVYLTGVAKNIKKLLFFKIFFTIVVVLGLIACKKVQQPPPKSNNRQNAPDRTADARILEKDRHRTNTSYRISSDSVTFFNVHDRRIDRSAQALPYNRRQHGKRIFDPACNDYGTLCGW